MGITYIARDYGVNVSIVRIQTTDTLGVASAIGYITAQNANIVTANSGNFTWQIGDEVLVQASDGNGFFQISNTFSSLIATNPIYSVVNNLTASPIQTQAGGTPLVFGLNGFSVVAATNNAATLPADVQGKTVIIVNNTTTPMNIFPNKGCSIDTHALNAARQLVGQTNIMYIGASATNWRTISTFLA